MITSRPAAVLLLACTLTACGAGGSATGTPASTSVTGQLAPTTPTAPATSVNPKQPLTDPEVLWLTHFDRTARQVTDGLTTGPRTIDSQATWQQMAGGLRTCGRALAAASRPTQRLMPVYDLFASACRHLDKAASCAVTAGELVKTPMEAGSDRERGFSEAVDCYSAETTQGSTVLASAQSKSYEIRSAAGDL